MVREGNMDICHFLSVGQMPKVPSETVSVERKHYEISPRSPIMPTRKYMSGNDDAKSVARAVREVSHARE